MTEVRPLARDAALSGLTVLLWLLLLSVALQTALALGAPFLFVPPLVYLAGLALVIRYVGTRHPHPRFGAANRITLARLALTSVIAGLLGEDGDAVAWTAVGIAMIVTAFDGVDGWIARRRGTASAFGARLDMETDALLILLLAALAAWLGKAGPWILLAGSLRYGFMAAGYRWLWLRAPLPPSKRRQTACVLQIVTLIVCLTPWLPPSVSGPTAGLGLAFLCYSFWVDIGYLIRHTPSK